MNWIREANGAHVLERGGHKIILREIGEAHPTTIVRLGFSARKYRITLLVNCDEVEERQCGYRTLAVAKAEAEKMLQ